MVTNVPQHVRVGPGNAHAAGLGEVSETAGGCVPAHPSATGVEQDQPCGPAAGGAVDRAADRWRQGDQHDLGSFATHPDDEAGNWHYRVPALHINGGGLSSRQDAEQDCLSAIAFALEGNPADYDPSAEALTLDVTVAPAA